MALRVAVTGASGRMGQAVARAISTEPETELACLVARPASQPVSYTHLTLPTSFEV